MKHTLLQHLTSNARWAGTLVALAMLGLGTPQAHAAPPASAKPLVPVAADDEEEAEEAPAPLPPPKPKKKAAKAKVKVQVEEAGEDLGLSETAEPARHWYRPSRADSRLPWNSHDAWGSSWHVSLMSDTQSLHALTKERISGLATIVGVEAGGSGFVARMATYGTNSAFLLGIGVPCFNMFVLKDLGLPDTQIGMTFGSFMTHYVPSFSTLWVEVDTVGVRATFEDFVVLEARVPLGFWVRPDATGFAWSIGAAVRAGVVF